MTIRLLGVSDLHQSAKLYQQLAEAVDAHRPDVVLLIGDILDSGEFDGHSMLTVAQSAEQICALSCPRLVMVRGNHEAENWPEFVAAWPAARRCFHVLNASPFLLGPLVVLGFPCRLGNENPWLSLLPKSGGLLPAQSWQIGVKPAAQPKPRSWLDPLYRSFGPSAGTLWLMHEPPAGRVIGDSCSTNRVWASAVARQRPLLTLSGHFHQAGAHRGRRWVRLGSTIAANAGQDFARLHYSLLELDFPNSLGPALPAKGTLRFFPGGSSITLPAADYAVRSCRQFPWFLSADRWRPTETRKRTSRFDPHAAGRALVQSFMRAEGGALSFERASECLNLSPEALQKRIDGFEFISWKDDRGGLQLPLWQFSPAGGVYPAVRAILKLFRSNDSWGILGYFLGQRRSLDGARPLDLIRQGRGVLVLKHARAHAKENTW